MKDEKEKGSKLVSQVWRLEHIQARMNKHSVNEDREGAETKTSTQIKNIIYFLLCQH